MCIRDRNEIDSIEIQGDNAGDYNLQNIIEATINKTDNIEIGKLKRNFVTNSSCGVCGKTSLDSIEVIKNNKMDLSLGIAVGSSTQIALFVAPLFVLVGWSIGQPLNLDFGLFATTITFVSILIVNSVCRDGRSDWLEGLMLVITYAIVAIAYWGM